MANPEITNNDPRKVEVFSPRYEDAVLTFAGADTLVAGTVMAQVVAAAGAVTADAGNTGDGTVTGFALAPGGPPLAGNWNLECTFVVTNGGVFKLEDPNGDLVADNLTLRVGAGLATTFSVAGLTFIITDGATDFAAGDKFELAVTDAGHKWKPYAVDALDGTGDPSGILPVEVVATGAGDLNRRMIIEGEVYEDKLVIDAGGSLTEAAIKALRDKGIILRPAVAMTELDNQ